MDIDQVLTRENFTRRETEWAHVPYEKELELLACVKTGDVERVKDMLFGMFPKHEGHMSENPRRNAIYSFVASVTLVTRFAVEGGLDVETAYSLSDAYIKSADAAKTPDDVFKLLPKMALDFTEKVRRAKRSAKPLTPVIKKAAEYIDSNLHRHITLEELGSVTRCNPAYISVKFKKETGFAVTDYINRAKIDAAKQLLQDTELTISDVAYTLAFSSQSYFSKLFRELTGEMPRDYRIHYFRTHKTGINIDNNQ